MRINYYEVLGVERSASEGDIRNRFRKLARERHPDRYRGADKADAERSFQTLTEALNVLTNPVKRKQHDLELQSTGSRPAADFAQVAKAYVARGVKAFKEGDYAAAREHFDMAVKHNPDDAKAFHYLALAAARQPATMRQAIQAIESAIQKDPVNPVYLRDAGMLCRRAGLPAKAERYLEEALQWDPESVEIRSALAEIRQGRPEARENRGLLDSLFKKG